MTLAEKLKTVRKQADMSQEKLAISKLFDISIDELLGNEKAEKKQTEYLFESVTEYNIDEPKRYDMKLGGAKQLVLSGYEGEKIRVRLASNTLSTLQSDFKIKKDNIKKRIDVDVNRKNEVTEATAKEKVVFLCRYRHPMSER